MFKAIAAFFNVIISFLTAAESLGRATEEVAITLEGRAQLYREEEEHKLALKRAEFMKQLQSE